MNYGGKLVLGICLCKFQIVKLLLQLCTRIMEVSKGEDMGQVGS
jgi:hypothetical protein